MISLDDIRDGVDDGCPNCDGSGGNGGVSCQSCHGTGSGHVAVAHYAEKAGDVLEDVLGLLNTLKEDGVDIPAEFDYLHIRANIMELV